LENCIRENWENHLGLRAEATSLGTQHFPSNALQTGLPPPRTHLGMGARSPELAHHSPHKVHHCGKTACGDAA
jgi:hypothetical protein